MSVAEESQKQMQNCTNRSIHIKVGNSPIALLAGVLLLTLTLAKQLTTIMHMLNIYSTTTVVLVVHVVEEVEFLLCEVFAILYLQSGQVQKVTQLQLSNWTPDGLCANPKTLVAATNLLFVVQRRCGNKSIVVHGR